MNPATPFQERFIFVCTAQKEGTDPQYCGNCGGIEVHAEMKKQVVEKGLQKKIRIVKSGCMDYCGKGPTVLVQPENKLYLGVKKEDVAAIVKEWTDS